MATCQNQEGECQEERNHAHLSVWYTLLSESRYGIAPKEGRSTPQTGAFGPSAAQPEFAR